MDRTAVYESLCQRVRWMKTSEEQPIFERYEMALYEKLSALTDAVCGGMIDEGRAELMLQWYISSLHPQEGSIRY